ncbi:hypothetical protein ACWD5R_25695 [Streptomyces sp. NPDC002514]|uniref:hypothetical protein n=1 Tax=unclassified Streptomyces TaxID=2593676 RepID=UPI0036CE094E
MLFLALLLLVATGAFTVLAIIGNLSGGPEYAVSVLGHHIATLGPVGIFCSGLALALLFCALLATVIGGASHHRRRTTRPHRARRTTVRPMAGPDARA